MNFKAIPLWVLLALQGCSSTTPSTSEVEKALAADYAACPNLELKNVKILNGRKLTEQVRESEVSFDLVVNALPKEKVEEAHQHQVEYDAEKKQLKDHEDELVKKHTELWNQSIAIPNQVYEQLRSIGLLGGTSAWLEREKVLLEQAGLPKVQADLKANEAELNNRSLFVPKTQLINLVDEWGGIDCLKKAGIEQLNDAEAVVSNGATNNFHGTINMEKTDNGWMAAK